MATHKAPSALRQSRRSRVSPSPSLEDEETDIDVSPRDGPLHEELQQPRRPSSGISFGQLSYAPTTQTTVVTTTTTTTTAFPPIVVKPPRQLRYANQEHYPLAATPTPASIKRLRFKIGGQDTYFEEAEDSEARLKEFNDRQSRLKAEEGVLRTVTFDPPAPQPIPLFRRSSILNEALEEDQGEEDAEASRNRSATPISLPDAAELHSFHRRNTKPRASTATRSRRDLEDVKGFLPAFEMGLGDQELKSRRLGSRSSTLKRNAKLTAATAAATDAAAAADPADDGSSSQRRTPLDNTEGSKVAADEAASIDSDIDPFSNIKALDPRRRQAAPSNITTSPLHDASLPSPSLSPITAAANLRDDVARRARSWRLNNEPHEQAPAQENSLALVSGDPLRDEAEIPSAKHPLMDIPNMLDTFDSIPDAMKTYIMYQMLRRCSKRTLLFVSEVIDPALRCDFLGRLPLELSLNITSHLDAQSLCRAAQVSKKWRAIIDSDERAWKSLIEEDGFILAEGEVERAVREGWGWQLPAGRDDADRDLRQPDPPSDSSPVEELSRRLSEGSAVSVRDSPTSALSKRKRKSSIWEKSTKRQRRIKGIAGQQRSAEWLDSLEEASGPVAYANAACMAMPDPGIGLPSLRRLSLFKAIYRRHCCIMKGWMDPHSEPLHLAFRAHQRHVVTCLQFDSDKILTGSDDANIDIYDTSNGASLKTLRGHDGGVWALEYHGDILVSGSTDRTVRVWSMKSGKQLHIFHGHTSTVRCLQILRPSKIGETPDGKPIMMPEQPLIITGSRDSTCRIWTLPEPEDSSYYGAVTELDNPYFVRVLTGHSNSVRAIAAHGDTLVSGSYDSTVRVWRISDGDCLHRLQGHTSKVYSVVLDHGRNRCISGSMDSLVKVWSLETGACLFNLDGHTSLVGLLDLKEDCLVSAAADATLRIWDPENGRCQHTLSAHTAAITCFAHDKHKIISGSDRTLKMWNAETGTCVRDLLTDLGGVWQIKFDQRRCVAAVQRKRWTYIEVLDFGASRDGWGEGLRGKRIVVDHRGRQIKDEEELAPEAEETVEI